MSNLQYAGEYKISELKLFTSSGNVVNLSQIYSSIIIYEDIFNSSMTGSILLVDTNNIIMNMPITGQDFISLKIETPGLEEHALDYTETTFTITKIDRKESLKNSDVIQLHFCSPEILRNNRVRVSKSYTSTIDKIVYDILNNAKYINTNKELFIEPTKGIRKIVTPNSHPFTIIKNLMRESLSKEYESPHYLFYENAAGLHFRSLDSLYRQASTGFYHAGDLGTVDNKNKLEQEYFTVISHQVSSNNDTLANIVGGMLASKITTYDIYQKNYSVDRHNYFGDFYKYKRVNYDNKGLDNPIYNEVPLDEFGNDLGNFDDSVIHLESKSTLNGADTMHYNELGSNSYSPSGIPKSILKRKSKFMELNFGTIVNMKIKGNTTIMVGDIVEFEIPVVGSGHGKDFDVYNSGRYLITKLKHIFHRPSRMHEIALSMSRDSYNEELTKIKQLTEPKGDKGMLHTQFY